MQSQAKPKAVTIQMVQTILWVYQKWDDKKNNPLFQQKEQQVLNDVENAETLSGSESAERF